MNQSAGLLYAAPIILIILALRIWRGSRARKLRVELMWVRPLLITAILGLSVAAQPPPTEPLVILAMVACAAAGFVLGWQRGRMVRVSIEPETHVLTSQQSPWGMLIFIGLMMVRIGVRYLLRGADTFEGVPVTAIVDGLTIFFGGNIFGMQLEVWLRARKLLAEAIARKAAGQSVPAEVTQDHA